MSIHSSSNTKLVTASLNTARGTGAINPICLPLLPNTWAALRTNLQLTARRPTTRHKAEACKLTTDGTQKQKKTTTSGFEPTRANPN
ncbi:hypothetical protein O181_117639 [Austropuccinia psidii MF-1]|uniref:Uncharacterized protein n=1 Tax=Austropuccinia psidii MF-1 TaxID=1389203 RepID=A0A9Q3PXP7_9BASI|nr:hypothetical protein [Austropuccinia psidii MF-1]